jgi:phospholipase/lecithinase/hemolysin
VSTSNHSITPQPTNKPSTPLHHNFTVSLVNQITQFKEYGHSTLSQHLPEQDTLIAIWIGINDVGDSSKYAVDFPTFYRNLITALFTSIDELYALGYRSYLLLDLPPLDRTPGNQATRTPHPNATQVGWYNDALSAGAEAFRKRRDVEIRVFDAHARLSWIMDHPGQYGIMNTTGYCAGYDQPNVEVNYEEYVCPVPLEKYFWFNSGHLTSHVHRILAGELEEWLRK